MTHFGKVEQLFIRLLEQAYPVNYSRQAIKLSISAQQRQPSPLWLPHMFKTFYIENKANLAIVETVMNTFWETVADQIIKYREWFSVIERRPQK